MLIKFKHTKKSADKSLYQAEYTVFMEIYSSVFLDKSNSGFAYCPNEV